MTGRKSLTKLVLAVLVGAAVLWPALVETGWQRTTDYQVAASSTSGPTKVEPLITGRSLGLTFRCPADGMAGLEFRVATYQRINPTRLVLLVYGLEDEAEPNPDPAARVPLRRSVIGAAGLQDWGPARFNFKPVEDSAGRRFYAVVMSPGTRVFECVGLIMTEGQGTAGWQGYSDGLPVADLPSARILVAKESGAWYPGWWWLLGLTIPAAVVLLWLRGS